MSKSPQVLSSRFDRASAGSMADPNSVAVGDVDVRVLALPRYEHPEQIRREQHAPDSCGRQFGTIVARLGFAQTDLASRLKARSSLIDLQLDIGKLRDLPPGATVVERYRRLSKG